MKPGGRVGRLCLGSVCSCVLIMIKGKGREGKGKEGKEKEEKRREGKEREGKEKNEIEGKRIEGKEEKSKGKESKEVVFSSKSRSHTLSEKEERHFHDRFVLLFLLD